MNRQELEEEILRLRAEVARLTDVVGRTQERRLAPAEHTYADPAEERFKRLVQNSTDMFAVTDRDGILASIYGPLERILGYKPEELIGTNCFKLIHREDLKTAIKAFNECLKNPDPPQNIEVRFRRKDGNWVILEAVGTSMIHDPVVRGIVLNARDISGRKKSEEDLIRLSIAIEQAAEEVIITDPNGTIQYVNPAFESITGFTRQEAIGQTPRLLKSGFHDDAFYRELWKTISDRRVWKGQFINRKKDGGLIHEEATISPVITSSGGLMGFVSLKRDISDELRLKARLIHSQKMEAVGTLAGGIAHDFNNILTVLIGCASVMEMEIDENDPMRPLVDEILNASKKASNLTRSLVVFSRHHDIALAPINLNEKIRGAEKLLRRLITEDISLEISVAPEDMFVMADSTQIDQVLFNLAANARDAMPDGGSLRMETSLATMDEVFIKTRGFGTAGVYVAISVSDTGHGIDSATKEKIFEPFFTTKEVGKGVGLGLATVYGIVEQHEGYITVESESNKGTTFQIYLPAITAPDKEAAEASAPYTQGRRTEIVLVAEDSESVRNSIAKTLKHNGYGVVEAKDGQDAIDRFKEHPEICLVILDAVMPRKNGKEVHDEIVKIRPSTKTIFISGYTKDIVLNKGIEEEDFSFLRKPLSPEVLLRKVRDVLDGYPQQLCG